MQSFQCIMSAYPMMGGVRGKPCRSRALILIKPSLGIRLFYQRVMGTLGHNIESFFVLIHNTGGFGFKN